MTEDEADTDEVLVEIEVPAGVAEAMEQSRDNWSVVVEWELN